MSGFPLTSEQLVRLVAAVVAEVRAPFGDAPDARPDAILIRLADAVGFPLETVAVGSRTGRGRGAHLPQRVETKELAVLPYGGKRNIKAPEPTSPSAPRGNGAADAV